MKRHLAGTISILAVLLLAGGCGDGKKGDGSVNNTLKQVQKSGVLKFGFDPSGGAPFADMDAKTNTVVGFEIEMMDLICKELGVKSEMHKNAWASLLGDLKSRPEEVDLLMNGFEINDDRKKEVLFSQPYYVYEQQLAVRAADKEKYKSLDDLKGKKIATLSGAEANNVLKNAGWTDDLLQQMEDSQQPYDMLKDGRCEAVLQENIIAAYYVPKYEGALVTIEPTFAQGVYGICFRPDDKELARAVDDILTKLKKNGELAKIYKKWNLWNGLQARIEVMEPEEEKAADEGAAPAKE